MTEDAADDAPGWVRWRRAERERLIAERLAIPAERRARIAETVAAALDAELAPGPGLVVSLYWPFRGELDLRPWMARAHESGARIALPVVVGKGRPLAFREWRPGCAMERGVWNIPQPADPAPVTPNVVIVPLVGFDARRYRLGYGGAFFDRTLASISPRPKAIGVGLAEARLDRFDPQPHDIPMDLILAGDEMLRGKEA